MSLSGQPKPWGTGSLFPPSQIMQQVYQQQQQQQQQQPPQTSSLFGNTMGSQQQQGNALGASMGQQMQPANQMPTLAQSAAELSTSLWQPGKETPHQKPIIEQIRLVTEKWDPSSPSCVFKHYFYNKVNEAHIPFYKPQPYEDPREWEEALQKKPAPGFMPVLCAGFSGVADRLKTQKRAVSDFNIRLHQVNAGLDALLQRHELETEVRAIAAQRRQTAISERCLALAARVQILRNRGYAMSSDEDELKNRLEHLEREVQDPAVDAREEELWSRLIVLRGYSERLNKELDKPANTDPDGLDDDTNAKAKRVLEDYDKQLQHLKKELEALSADFDEWEKSRVNRSKSR
ncbi:hypothetical protein CDD81_846 [Ophiocordyceps australis]|uniref:Nucleoporin Nup54 alpha-helical domain-containing protein n=1 Tax=Ophiocordyceps australis TaxID=1399860 RepID=A0A2C5Y233_9HYPO|nr:hypothetical protein CDD81_846 [Ophiocordyceps australis]